MKTVNFNTVSGHSKWSTIKHKKSQTDARRGKLFAKLIKQVEVAAREGGGDPDSNPTLRTMYQKARDNSVPLDTIERAIKRGTGELEGVNYVPVSYEAYAPAGVALYIECLTDNRNRTGSDVRSTLTRAGGSLAQPGSVSWQFERKGLLNVKATVDEDELMVVAIDTGAEDIVKSEEAFRVITEATELHLVRQALEDAGIPFDSADVVMQPTTTVVISDVATAKQIVQLMDALDNLDDVQEVYANFDISDELLDSLA
ncbi:MAG: YebC/PmpR family DNA-binding transcriptional regulator [Acidimicrobiaceae bacterium]|nr:YebC/PmpR family DNA-binding transcriptional regulator [Acidimicrobiaceae bacterium]